MISHQVVCSIPGRINSSLVWIGFKVVQVQPRGTFNRGNDGNNRRRHHVRVCFLEGCVCVSLRMFSYTCGQPSSNGPCNQGVNGSNGVFSGFDWLTACAGEVGSPPWHLGFAPVPQEVMLYFSVCCSYLRGPPLKVIIVLVLLANWRTLSSPRLASVV